MFIRETQFNEFYAYICSVAKKGPNFRSGKFVTNFVRNMRRATFRETPRYCKYSVENFNKTDEHNVKLYGSAHHYTGHISGTYQPKV
jgi:hypothetical protein